MATLFKFSLAALIEHVKNKKLKVSPDQIPTNIHQFLWNNSTVLDLIINTCHPETRIWFSTRVIQPPVINVDFPGTGFLSACVVKIRFEGRPTISWMLACPDLMDSGMLAESPYPKFIIRTGNQYLSTRMNNNNENFTSRLVNYDRACLEVVNWICKAFRCEISELVTHYDDRMSNWPKLKLANFLRIYESPKLENLKELLIARQKNNLASILHCGQ